MTLQDTNTALNHQRRMKDSGKHEDFLTVFSQALRGDQTAFQIFEAWTHIHPDLADALDFLNAGKDRSPLAIALGGTPRTVQT